MSKYSSLLQAKQEPSPISEEPKQETGGEPAVKPVDTSVTEIPAPAAQTAIVASAPASKVLNMEPPRGKKGNPDYNQVTIYLKKQTQNQAKIAMLQSQDERDFSELVEDLLREWLVGKSV